MAKPEESLNEHLDASHSVALAQDLETYEQTGELPAEYKPAFVIENLSAATWAVRKIAHLRQQIAGIDATADAEVKRIREWQQKATLGHQGGVGYLTMLLEHFHRQVLAEDPKAKTVSTPYGKLQLRAQQPKWEYDDDALLAWLQANHPEWVRNKPEADKATVKAAVAVKDGRAVDDAGEIVPGISVLDRPPSFSVVTQSGE